MTDEPASEAVERAAPADVAVVPAEPAPVAIDRPTRWLREHRLQLAIGIAIAETIFVLLEDDFSRVTVIVVAIPVIGFYLLAGRTLDTPLWREVSWILAVSQAMALAAAVVALVFSVAKLVLAGAIAAAVVYLLFFRRSPKPRDGAAA